MNPYVAEFVGTTVLILLGNGVVANVVLADTKGHNGGWLVITTAWALAVFVGVVIAGPSSGAHLNPAVTLGLAVAGQFAWNLVLGYVVAQLAGAFVGATLVWAVYKDHFDRTPEPLLKLAVFCTGPAIRHHASNLLSEIVGTLVLVLTVFLHCGRRNHAHAHARGAGLGGRAAGGVGGVGDWAGAGRHYRLRHQPRPRPGPAPGPRPTSHPG